MRKLSTANRQRSKSRGAQGKEDWRRSIPPAPSFILVWMNTVKKNTFEMWLLHLEGKKCYSVIETETNEKQINAKKEQMRHLSCTACLKDDYRDEEALFELYNMGI